MSKGKSHEVKEIKINNKEKEMKHRKGGRNDEGEYEKMNIKRMRSETEKNREREKWYWVGIKNINQLFSFFYSETYFTAIF